MERNKVGFSLLECGQGMDSCEENFDCCEKTPRK